MPSRTELGNFGEETARNYLQEKGYELLERNYRLRFAEIDIIARYSGYIIFIEVKYRNNLLFGYPREAVTKEKQSKIRMAAEFYASEHDILIEGQNIRFDVIEIINIHGKTNIEHIENAF